MARNKGARIIRNEAFFFWFVSGTRRDDWVKYGLTEKDGTRVVILVIEEEQGVLYIALSWRIDLGEGTAGIRFPGCANEVINNCLRETALFHLQNLKST